MCRIRTFWDNMDLSPKCYTSSAKGGTASVLAIQFHPGLTLFDCSEPMWRHSPPISHCCYLSVKHSFSSVASLHFSAPGLGENGVFQPLDAQLVSLWKTTLERRGVVLLAVPSSPYRRWNALYRRPCLKKSESCYRRAAHWRRMPCRRQFCWA